jgi:hypothetical protein
VLLAMPFVQSLLPEFVAASAIITLQATIDLVENSLLQFEGLSNAEKLSNLQNMQSRLSSVAKNQCAEANAKLAHINNRDYFGDPIYIGYKNEALTYYNSQNYAEHKLLNKRLIRRIIDLHKEGITNADSFNPKGLKLKASDFASVYQQEYRFEQYKLR